VIEGVLWTVILGAVVVYALWARVFSLWLEHRSVRTRIRDTPALATDSAEGDRVRVTGTVLPLAERASAPLTRRPCAMARVGFWCQRHRYDSSAPFESFATVPFEIETREHGRVRIHTRYANLSIPTLRLRDHRAVLIADT